jgi:ketosteroid isomerase-like protein
MLGEHSQRGDVMLIRRILTFVCCGTLIAASNVFAQNLSVDNAAEQQIIRLRKELAAAELRGDVSFLQDLFADEYTHLHADGRLETKTEYLNRFKSGSRKYQLNEVQDIQVRLYGTTAVVLSRGHTKSTNDGSPRDVQNQFMEVWVRQGAKWQVVAWVTTGVPQIQKDAAAVR